MVMDERMTVRMKCLPFGDNLMSPHKAALIGYRDLCHVDAEVSVVGWEAVALREAGRKGMDVYLLERVELVSGVAVVRTV
jgi:hypothetical protein